MRKTEDSHSFLSVLLKAPPAPYVISSLSCWTAIIRSHQLAFVSEYTLWHNQDGKRYMFASPASGERGSGVEDALYCDNYMALLNAIIEDIHGKSKDCSDELYA